MKNKIFAIGLVLILTGIFTGCILEQKDDAAEVNADSVLDNKIYEQAVEDVNEESCGKIASETKMEECKKTIQSLKLTDQAIKNIDKSLCAKIGLDRYKENCENAVEKEEAKASVEDKKVELGLLAIEKKDVKVCDGITDENYRSECILNVLLDESYEGTDSSECDIIANSALKEVCRNDSKWN